MLRLPGRKESRNLKVLIVFTILSLVLTLHIFARDSAFSRPIQLVNLSPINLLTVPNETENNIALTEAQPIIILVWKSTHNPPSNGTVGRIARDIAEMNQDDGAFCRNRYGKMDPTWNNITCQFTMDTQTLQEADALSFSMFNSGYSMSNLPQHRTSNQLWVSFVQEAPIHSLWVDPLRNLFNWTMSYRSDSEIFNPYGRKLMRERPISQAEAIMFRNISLDEWIAGKDKLVAGVISNCRPPSKRQLLIEKMNKTGGQVDIYGHCGNKKAGCDLVSSYNRQCDDYWHKFASQYKFFLAFENSLCRDYITEKFWRTLEIGMVPVVYGGGYYRADAPPYSYIDAREFHSAGELMKFLNKLANDTKEYARYFEWRREYTIEQKWSRGFCNLCKAVYDHKMGTKKLDKVYENLKEWWKCHPGSDIPACEKAQEFVD